MVVSALGFGASALAVSPRPNSTPRSSAYSSCSLVDGKVMYTHIRVFAHKQGVFHDVTQEECIQVVHQTLKAGIL